MSDARFSIVLDPAMEMVRISMSGFFGQADIDRFQAELQQAHRRLACRHPDGPLTLNDISGMAIQSQDAMSGWRALLTNAAHRSRRLAFVVESALARMQLERVISGRQAQVFTDGAEAATWLMIGSADVRRASTP